MKSFPLLNICFGNTTLCLLITVNYFENFVCAINLVTNLDFVCLSYPISAN